MPENIPILQNFIQSLVVNDPKTIKAYETVVRQFVLWLKEQPGGNPFEVTNVTETAIHSYLNHLTNLGRAPRTRRQALTALRRFCRWAVVAGHLSRNPAIQVQPPTVINMAPIELSQQQRYVLKNRVEAEQSYRSSAIFALGYWAGLRISEIATLKIEDCHINQRSGHITIMDSKGGKTRTLDLHSEARRALYNYLYNKEGSMMPDARDPDSFYVFTSQRASWLRQQERPDHLSVRGIEHIWTATKKRSKQDEYVLIQDVKFHDLRHDFAHRARAGGWDLEEIAVYLGHQTHDGLPAIATTVRYTLPSRQQLKRKLRQLMG